MVADHMRDVTDLFNDLVDGTLPAVSYVKPDGLMDGHPASSKWTLFEAFAENIIELAQSNKEQWAKTAIFVTVDEGGGYYDSGFIQWVDFFGTGPRIPMIAVSPFSTGGHVSHVYNEHSSFVKFVERNWKLARSATAAATSCPTPSRTTMARTPMCRATCQPSAICSTCSISATGPTTAATSAADQSPPRARPPLRCPPA
jgi:phospholipase C